VFSKKNMDKPKYYLLVTFLFVTVFFCSSPLFASVMFSASVDSNRVYLNDTFMYTLTLSGGGRTGKPKLPVMKEFDVLGTSTSSTYSFANGVQNASTAFEYTLIPRKKGSFSIRPSEITVDGKLYKTGVVKVTVLAGSGKTTRRQNRSSRWSAFGSNDPFSRFFNKRRDYKSKNDGVVRAFAKAQLSKPVVYVNEQLIYIFKFYRRLRLSQNPNYASPDMTGFVVVDVPEPQKDYRENVKGLDYKVAEIRTALFPTSPGDFTIGQATLSIPGGFFSRGSIIKTKPLEIKVLPLPMEGRPDNFSGLVGKFTIKAILNKASVKLGQPVTVTVTVHGFGNIDNIQKPVIPEQAGYTIYSSKETKSLDKGKGVIEGGKTFETIVVARKVGSYSLGKLSCSFFDPAKKEYVVAYSDEVKLLVTPSSTPLLEDEPSFATPVREDAVHKDIAYIKPDVDRLSDDGPVYTGWFFWFLQLLPLLSVVGTLVFCRHREKMNTDIAYARLQKAKKITRKLMRDAENALQRGDEEEFFSSLSKALTEYIGNKFNLSSAGLTSDIIKDELASKDIVHEDIEKVTTCLESCYIARFASAAHTQEDMAKILATANEAILAIEKKV